MSRDYLVIIHTSRPPDEHAMAHAVIGNLMASLSNTTNQVRPFARFSANQEKRSFASAGIQSRERHADAMFRRPVVECEGNQPLLCLHTADRLARQGKAARIADAVKHQHRCAQ
jgi:hypothetical protein